MEYQAQSQAQAPLIISASFVADPLLSPLTSLLSLAGVGLQPKLGPYNQIFQTLLDPDSALARSEAGVNLVLLRLEDFARDHDDLAHALAAAQRAADDLPAALEIALARTGRPLLFAALPISPAARARLGDRPEELRQQLLNRLRGVAGLMLLEDSGIDRVANGAREDEQADRLAHIPYTDSHFAALALALTRKLHALLVPAHKVLVLDCDNTLWRGVVGEDGAAGIELPPGLLALQRCAVDLQNDGVLIALASKNVDEDVAAVFDRRSDMLLRPEHIVARRVNWLPKPENLRSLATELNLGLDAFVFIDDNPVECAQMRAALPQVVTLQLPADDAAVPALLEHLWTFDGLALTAEDRQRTAMYRENLSRRQCESAAASFSDFIASLDMQIDIAAPAADEWARIAQLSQRTNQFNFTTRRYAEVELRDHAAHGEVLRVRVRDRFGDYGLVGVATGRAVGDVLHVDSIFLSCRALGRGVEHALLAELGRRAINGGLTHVRLPFRPTAKNLPARAFAESTVGDWRRDADWGDDYLIPAPFAAGLRYRSGDVPQGVMDALRAEENKAGVPAALPAASPADRSTRYARLATELVDGPSVLAWLHAQQRQPRRLLQPSVPAADAREAAMLELWTEVLQIDNLGIEDDFHALGGSSLQAARLIAAIERRFGPRWPFTTLLTARTPRAMVAKLDQDPVQDSNGPLVILRPGNGPRLFLVHDGDGETLLYRNLALRLPEDIGIVGIEPLRRPGIPLAHLRIEDMAAAYIAAMRKLQPEGPYRLAGMCAGGVIAYEMARQLRASGAAVEFVMLLDAAAPGAPRRAGVGGRSHVGRTLDAIRATGGSLMSRGIALAALVLRRGWNFMRWRIAHRLKLAQRQRRFERLSAALTMGLDWPAGWPPLTVREIYEEAERRYRPGPLADVPLLLVRATVGDGDGGDTPYATVFVDSDLGWGRVVAANPRLIDVDGGHASMLQEPYVASLAKVFRMQLEAA
ncbi:MAG: HAD-IIIC family phosphatase [Rhodocyclaceae bacterium]|nr:HAD-IIIC family phosphatase [Rhodocyclaceae bacterium]MDZ4216499.1 HAD-IIIC family phosphatase [Rhodocyclaceae bacterium]